MSALGGSLRRVRSRPGSGSSELSASSSMEVLPPEPSGQTPNGRPSSSGSNKSERSGAKRSSSAGAARPHVVRTVPVKPSRAPAPSDRSSAARLSPASSASSAAPEKLSSADPFRPKRTFMTSSSFGSSTAPAGLATSDPSAPPEDDLGSTTGSVGPLLPPSAAADDDRREEDGYPRSDPEDEAVSDDDDDEKDVPDFVLRARMRALEEALAKEIEQEEAREEGREAGAVPPLAAPGPTSSEEAPPPPDEGDLVLESVRGEDLARRLDGFAESQAGVRAELAAFVAGVRERIGEDGELLVDFGGFEGVVDGMLTEAEAAEAEELEGGYGEARRRFLQADRLAGLPRVEEDEPLDGPKAEEAAAVRAEMDRIRELDAQLAAATRKARAASEAGSRASSVRASTSSASSLSSGLGGGIFITEGRPPRSSRRAIRNALRSSGESIAPSQAGSTATWATGASGATNYSQRNAELGPLAKFFVLDPDSQARVEEILARDETGLEGYVPAEEDLLRMEEIDARLQAIIPDETWADLTEGGSVGWATARTARTAGTSRTSASKGSSVKTESGQDDFLRQQREEREGRERLRAIHDRIRELYETPRPAALAPEDLQRLLAEARRDQARIEERARMRSSQSSMAPSEAPPPAEGGAPAPEGAAEGEEGGKPPAEGSEEGPAPTRPPRPPRRGEGAGTAAAVPRLDGSLRARRGSGSGSGGSGGESPAPAQGS